MVAPSGIGPPLAASRQTRALFAAIAVLLTGACAIGPPERPVTSAVAELPTVYEQADTGASYEPVRWWRSYEDPVLDRLVQTAMRNNLDIGEAIGRVEEVRARYVRERADLFPSLDAGLEGNYANQPVTGLGAALGGGREPGGGSGGDADGGSNGGGDNGGGSGGGPGGSPSPAADRFSFSTFTAQLQFSYEVDFWGRIRNQSRAAAENYRASLSDLQTVRLSIASEVMRNYFDLVEGEQLLDINTAQADILEERVTLAQTSFLRGLASSFELISLRENRREAEAVIPQLEARLYATKTRLAVLLGTYPETLDEFLKTSESLVVTLPMEAVPSGLPVELLAQRPDVRAAYQRLDAARYGVAAARAARLPRLSFNASGGLESDEPGGLADPQNWFLNLIGALTAPILDGGRLDANVDISEARMRQRAYAYGQAVLTAFAEVERALARNEAAVRRVRLLQRDLETAQDASDLLLRRFERGIADYSDYLDARLNVLGSRRSIIQAERAVAEARLGVHRSLGGAWMEDWLHQAALAEVADELPDLPSDYPTAITLDGAPDSADAIQND